MSKCPFHQNTVRSDLPPLTDRIGALPVDERGYPVPFFVHQGDDGKYDFRVVGENKFATCHNERRCWVCGQPLGRFVTFVIGPMCTINRTTAEPPSHKDCAEWSVVGCPFLSRPNMVRREGGLSDENKGNVAGNMIERNPGVSCLWTSQAIKTKTRGYEIFYDYKRRPLIQIGDPVEVSWWREGRKATRAEVVDSIDTGLPLLAKGCELELLESDRQKAREMLADHTRIALQYIPGRETNLILP